MSDLTHIDEDRETRARHIGDFADRVFAIECRRLGLDISEAVTAPLASLAAAKSLSKVNDTSYGEAGK